MDIFLPISTFFPKLSQQSDSVNFLTESQVEIAADLEDSASIGPSLRRKRAAPEGYAATFSDVTRAQDLSLISDPDMHYTMYGYTQGRKILQRLTTPPEKVLFISPSHLKECGIGEYGRYLSGKFANCVKQVKVVRTSAAALDCDPDFLADALIIVNHGPGLFDGLNPRLSQGESTIVLLQNLSLLATKFGAIPLFMHHSLVDTDHEVLFSKQQLISNSEIPQVAFISSAGRNFFMPTIELGVSPVSPPEHEYAHTRNARQEVLGFFGFFQYGGKDFDSLFHLARELRANLVGSVATSNADELLRFEETLEAGNIPHDFGSGWVSDTELLDRLKEADYFYLPQNDYDHWNNSATARFVTNLPRPLFLPPHHPFLDMQDGSIFATKDDLPRLVAFFREEKHYDQAVKRVEAFRERADMSNTALALKNSLVPQMNAIGEQLLLDANATSLERYLELGPEQQERFSAAQNWPKNTSLPDVFATTGGALTRHVPAKQYWRRHYELGDFIFPTLNETINAIYLNICKRYVSLEELSALTHFSETHDGADDAFGQIAHEAFVRAMRSASTTFSDPDFMILSRGHAVPWRQAIAPDNIMAFLASKLERRTRIEELRKSVPLRAPDVTNIVDLLVQPPEALRMRQAPIDISELDLEYIQAPDRLSSRLNRLIRNCNQRNIDLTQSFVFDELQVRPIQADVTAYTVQDFMFYERDQFLQNALRCIAKRDPFPLEMMTLASMFNAFGRESVLRHLVEICDQGVTIFNLKSQRHMAFTKEYGEFVRSARDPLMGLIDARNAYEVLRRHNTRWWHNMQPNTAEYWSSCEGNLPACNLIYGKLAHAPGLAVSAATKNLWHKMASDGFFMDRTTTASDALPIGLGEVQTVSDTLSIEHAGAFQGFHEIEAIGAWSMGTSGNLMGRLNLQESAPEGDLMLRFGLGFFGSEHTGPRTLHISVRGYHAETDNTFIETVSQVIDSDHPIFVDIPCPDVQDETLVNVSFVLDKVTSPKATSTSSDPRQLGVLVRSIELKNSTEAVSHDHKSDVLPLTEVSA